MNPLTDLVEKLSKQNEASEAELAEALKSRADSILLLGEDVFKDGGVAETGLEEGKDAAMFYLMGLSRRLIDACQGASALSIGLIMSQPITLNLMTSMMLISYMRGYMKGKEQPNVATAKKAEPDSKIMAGPSAPSSVSHIDEIELKLD